MKNRVYYGEYSLRHWIELVLKRKIHLPKYQRYFVWEESDLRMLIDTLKNGRFIPPITVGAYKENDTITNIIIDGQQRLTSLLLAYIGRFPNKSWADNISLAANSDDSDASDDFSDEADEMAEFNPREWSLNNLLKDNGNTKEALIERCLGEKYLSIAIDVDEKFWDENFIGFCYLVPGRSSEEEQQEFFCSTFRDMNICGKRLNEQDSRRSLYFLRKDVEKLFEPDFAREITLRSNSKKNSPSHIDFVRYLALLSNYLKSESFVCVARGRKATMDKYYEEYVFSVVNHKTDDKFFKPFSEIFHAEEYLDRLNNLNMEIIAHGFKKEYVSIVDMDVVMFGLIYWVFYKGKRLSVQNEDLWEKLKGKIDELKRNDAHKRSPALLKYLRERMNVSISLYREFVSNGTAS